MGFSRDCAGHVANIVFGCAGLTFGGIAAAAAGPLAAGATLIALAGFERSKAKPDDKKKIDALIGKLADAADKASKTQKHERGRDIRAAETALSDYLPKIDISHGQLAKDAFEEGGFPSAATERVLAALVALEEAAGGETADRLFCPTHGKADAIQLAEDVFNAAFGLALNNRDYFESLEPHLIVGIAQGVGDLKRGQGEAREERADIMAELKAFRAEMAAETGLTLPQVEAILKSFGHESIPQERWESALYESAAKLKDLEERLSLPSNDDIEIRTLLDLAREAIDRADFDGAEEKLAEAERRDLEAGEQRIRRAAKSREKRAELAWTQGRYLEAADHYAEAARVIRTFDPMDWARLKYNEGTSAYERGQYDPERDPLNRAVRAYRAALEEWTRDRVPLDWATTQNNFGSALQELGERGDEAALHEAIAAYRAALEERTRDRVPLNWATTQNNLGNALAVLGTRGDEATLHEAIAAYRAALEERTRDRVPLDWAATQNNFGIALRLLSVRGDEAALHEAIMAFRAALEEWTRDRAPMDWAMTQNNLGSALETLGDHAHDPQHWSAAEKHYLNALEEFTEARAPAYNEIAKRNLDRVREKLNSAKGE